MNGTAGKIAGTTGVLSGGSWSIILLKYIFACLGAGKILMPDENLTIILGTLFGVFVMAIWHLIEKKSGLDLDGDGNIADIIVKATPPQPIPGEGQQG